MTDKYILDEHGEPVPCPDLLEWAKWFETSRAQRRVAVTEVSPGIRVSTVFLALDHAWIDHDKPVLWETMVFNDYDECFGIQERYTTKAEALADHWRIVAEVAEKLGLPVPVQEKPR